MALTRIACTITRAGRHNEFGQALTVGASYTGDADFVQSLVTAGFASLADATLLYTGNPAKYVSTTDIAQPTLAMLGNTQAVYRQGSTPFASFSSNGTALVQVAGGGSSTYTTRQVAATTYTLVSGDNNNGLNFTAATGVTITIPAGLGADFNVAWFQSGAGQLTFSPSGTTLQNVNTQTKSSGQFAAGSLVAVIANTFNLSGSTGV